MVPKFAIIFSGIEIDAVVNFMQEMKQKLEDIEIEVEMKTTAKGKSKTTFAKPKINVVVSTYYKRTALEGLTKKLEEYLDEAPKEENTINYL